VTSVALHCERSERHHAVSLVVEGADPARSGAWRIDVTAARSGGQDDRPAALNPHGSVAETLRRGEQLYRKLGEQLPNVAVLVFDADMRVLVAVGEALTSHGVRARDVEGSPLREVMNAETYRELESLYRGALRGERRETEHTSGDRTFRVFGKPMLERDGQVWAGLALAQDITDLRATETRLRIDSERLAALSVRDDLTGLANRALFRDRLAHALVTGHRLETQVAVMFIDVDRFKTVNDTLGHQAGDELLQTIAGLLTASVRAADTVARLGGDEFAVLIEHVHDTGEVVSALDRIFAALSVPVILVDTEVRISVSVGVALGPHDGDTWEVLLVAADQAMYSAKAQGGRRHRFYDPAMQDRARERLAIETALHHALRRDELVLHYQPAIEFLTGRVTSVEALIRWNHPQRGLLLPGSFIPIAEETALAAEITEWVVRRACAQVKAWRDEGQTSLRVAVNSCSRELGGRLLALVKSALGEAGLPGDAMEIEITERFLGHEDAVRDAMLSELRDLGVRVALDDFGTGYSSLARLRSFPVDVLKLDRMFIAELPENSAIADSVITLARNLGVIVIAEGVENDCQYAWLEQAGCHAAAGYLLCPPQTAAEFGAWTSARRDGGAAPAA
jgi:diguanylate cyclase (GGDEF)-like protein/PAS domain S-box-containing protein